MLKKILFLLFFSSAFLNGFQAAVGITAPSLSIATCTFPSSYQSLGDIVIDEGNNADFAVAAGVTLILTAPANFQFNPGVGTVTQNGGTVNLSALSIAVTATTITITYTSGGTNRDDILTISGIQVRAITGASSGSILRTAGSPGTGTISGIANGTTSFGSLTSTLSCSCTHTLRLTDTFGDGWNGGTVSVSVNGVVVLNNVQLAGGAGPSDVTFSAASTDVIRVYETAAGSWPTEMRVEVLDGGMTTIVAQHDPNAGTATTGGSTGVGNCPPPMNITAATVTQVASGALPRCGANQGILCLQITTTGVTSPKTVTQIQTNVSGTITMGAISNVDVYYTGTSSTFATTTLFGSNASPSTSTYNINGSQNLQSGVNYFWLVYDLNNTGTLAATVDGLITQFTASATNYNTGSSPAISTTNPAGSGSLTICTAPGGILTGLDIWVKADVGLTNQAPSATGITANGAPAINSVAQSYNYNPYIDFTAPAATLDGGLAASRQFLKINGFSDIAGIDYRTFFFTLQLDDLTRVNTHLATVSGITTSAGPASGTLHGHLVGAQAAIHQDVYDADFASTAPAGTWKQNYANASATSLHLTSKHIVSASSANPTMINVLLGGQNDLSPASSFAGHARDWKGPVAEVIAYTTQLNATDNQKVHSYLAIKYGLTLPMNYLNTAGSTIFTYAAPYNLNIIGIGRDDNEALNQKQSHQNDDTVRIYISGLAAMNASNGGSFSTDNSYVLQGSDNRKLCSSVSAMSEVPTGLTNCLITSRLEREWKVTRTNMAQSYNMDVKLSSCANPGSVNVAHLRLLVDDDGNFGNGGTQCYYNGDGSGIVFSYSNPTITISNISTTHIPNNATKFITIASINLATPLPVEFLYFDAKLNEKKTVDLPWLTTREVNNDYFEVEKSLDAKTWVKIAEVDGHGSSSEQHSYYLEDLYPQSGNNYYRLKQFDFNGEFTYSDIRSVELSKEGLFVVYPNPGNQTVILNGAGIANHPFEVLDYLGNVVAVEHHIISGDHVELNTEALATGLYCIRVWNGTQADVQKVMIVH